MQRLIKTKPLLEHIKELANKIYNQMIDHENPTIALPMNYDTDAPRKFKKLKTIAQNIE